MIQMKNNTIPINGKAKKVLANLLAILENSEEAKWRAAIMNLKSFIQFLMGTFMKQKDLVDTLVSPLLAPAFHKFVYDGYAGISYVCRKNHQNVTTGWYGMEWDGLQ